MISIDLFNIIVLSWIGIGVLLFPVMLKITTPYGRHTKKNWGPLIHNRLGWIIMELPALVVFAFFILKGGRLSENIVLVAFVLWMAHYVNRTLIFPLRIRTNSKKMPLAIVGMAFFFNLDNGFLNGYWLGVLSPPYPAGWIWDPRFIIGVALFITGFWINLYHDNLLIRLRKNNGTAYKIPQGGLFKYISCPNFFGEIIQWGRFALFTWCLPSLAFFIWTVVNLIPRAIHHHRWYNAQFKNYPEYRKAIVPLFL